MISHKSPREDGYLSIFYQHYWEIMTMSLLHFSMGFGVAPHSLALQITLYRCSFLRLTNQNLLPSYVLFPFAILYINLLVKLW